MQSLIKKKVNNENVYKAKVDNRARNDKARKV